MDQILNRIFEVFSLDKITKIVLNIIPKFIVAIVIILVFIILWKLLKRTSYTIFKKISLDKTLQNMITNVLKTFIFIIGAIIVLREFGIDIGAILAGLGVVGLTLGFAAQDALSNIISGIFIFWDKPFVIGDLIEVNEHYGRVDIITMRSTRLITVNGKMLSIPNSEIINSTVASYTNFPNLRIDIDFTVSANENLKKIRELLYKIVENDNDYLLTPQPEVVLNKLNDYNIELIFRVWIKDEQKHISKSNNLREKIFETLTKENVDMPYETVNVIVSKNSD